MSKQISKEKRIIVYNKYNGCCAYCGVTIYIDKFHIDHIEAKFRGSTQKELDYYKRTKGDDSLDNLNPSCGSCNSSKSTFTIEQWRNEIQLKQARIKRDSSTFRILERFGLIEVKNIPVIFYFEKEVKNG